MANRLNSSWAVALSACLAAFPVTGPAIAQPSALDLPADRYSDAPKYSVGDVNGDGVPDTIQPRPMSLGDGRWRTSFAFFGGRSRNYQGELIQPTIADEYLFGHAYAFGPDVDGDGVREVFVSSPLVPLSNGESGVVYVYSPRKAAPLYTITGTGKGAFGTDLLLEHLAVAGGGSQFVLRVASHIPDDNGNIWACWTSHLLDGTMLETTSQLQFKLVHRSGDVNGDGSTTTEDVIDSLTYQVNGGGGPATTIVDSLHDIDGSGAIDAIDIGILITKLGTDVPSAGSVTFGGLAAYSSSSGLPMEYLRSDPRCLMGMEYIEYPPSDIYPDGWSNIPDFVINCCVQVGDVFIVACSSKPINPFETSPRPPDPRDTPPTDPPSPEWWPEWTWKIFRLPRFIWPTVSGVPTGFYRDETTHGNRQPGNAAEPPQDRNSNGIPDHLEGPDAAERPNDLPEGTPTGGGSTGSAGANPDAYATVLVGDIEKINVAIPAMRPSELFGNLELLRSRFPGIPQYLNGGEPNPLYHLMLPDVRAIRVVSSDPTVARFVVKPRFAPANSIEAARGGETRWFSGLNPGTRGPSPSFVEARLVSALQFEPDGLPTNYLPPDTGRIRPRFDNTGRFTGLTADLIRTVRGFGNFNGSADGGAAASNPSDDFDTALATPRMSGFEIQVAGLKPGRATIRLEIEGFEGQIPEMQIVVGGTVSVAIHEAPKWTPSLVTAETGRWNDQDLQNALLAPELPESEPLPPSANTGKWVPNVNSLTTSNAAYPRGPGARLGMSPGLIRSLDLIRQTRDPILPGNWPEAWQNRLYDQSRETKHKAGYISVRARDAFGDFKPNRPVSIISLDNKVSTLSSGGFNGRGRSVGFTGGHLVRVRDGTPGYDFENVPSGTAILAGHGTKIPIGGNDAVVSAEVAAALNRTGMPSQAVFEGHGGVGRVAVLVGMQGMTLADCGDLDQISSRSALTPGGSTLLKPVRKTFNGEAVVLDQTNGSSQQVVAPETIAWFADSNIPLRAGIGAGQGPSTPFSVEVTAAVVPIPVVNQYTSDLIHSHMAGGGPRQAPPAYEESVPAEERLIPLPGTLNVVTGEDETTEPLNSFVGGPFGETQQADRAGYTLAREMATNAVQSTAALTPVPAFATHMRPDDAPGASGPVNEISIAPPSVHSDGATSEHGNPIIQIGAVVADISLAFIPGYDVVDAGIYGFWKPVVEGDENKLNKWIALASVAGLAADAGYFAGPVGVLTNSVPAIVKVGIKWIAKRSEMADLIMTAIIKFGSNGREALQRLTTSIGRHWDNTLDYTNISALTDWAGATTKNVIEWFLRPDRVWAPIANAGSQGVAFADNALGAWQTLLHKRFKAKGADAEKISGAANVMALCRDVPGFSPAEVQQVCGAVGRVHVPNGLDPDEARLILRAGDLAKERGAKALGDCAKRARQFDRVNFPNANPQEIADLAAKRAAYERAVQDAMTNAKRPWPEVGGVQQVPTGLQSLVGPGKAFNNMEEFELMRTLPVEFVPETQRAALYARRLAVPDLVVGEPVAKVMRIDTTQASGSAHVEYGALDMILGGRATFGGFFARSSDIVSNSGGNASMFNRLRLDYTGSPFAQGQIYAVMRTKMTQPMVNSTKIPLNSVPVGANPSRIDTRFNPPPGTGNGTTASLDPNPINEYRKGYDTPPVDETTLEFVDGNGNLLTNLISGLTSAKYRLRADPLAPRGISWEPIP